MTFADLIYKTWCAIMAHRTKLSGIATSWLAYTATQHWLPPGYVDGLLFASGTLTILCGVANSSAIAAKVVAHTNFTQPASPASPERNL